MAFVAAAYWRRGLVLVATAAVLGGVLRLVLPTRRAGWLAVRSRSVDVLCLGSFGIALAVIAIVVPAQ